MRETLMDTSAEYRRRARRLRWRYARNPQRKQEELAQLAAQPRISASPIPVTEAFAGRVASAMDGPILSFSKRQSLMKEAERRGIGRFEANLVIAAVLHRTPKGAIATGTHRTMRFPVGVATFVVVEGLIALGAWWMIGG